MHAEQGVAPQAGRAACIFEYVYFARPDSVIDGQSVYQARRNMGRILAQEAPVEADLVLGVPDSGVPPALGFAEESGIPYADGIVKNRYVGRTFIEPTQAMRQLGIRLKLNPLPLGDRGQAPRGHRRQHRARQHVEEARADAARRGRDGGAPAHREPGGEVAVLLRHRHRHARPAHRGEHDARRDERVDRLGLAGVHLARRACAPPCPTRAARAFATPASRATTRWRFPPPWRRRASTRRRISRRYTPKATSRGPRSSKERYHGNQ